MGLLGIAGAVSGMGEGLSRGLQGFQNAVTADYLNAQQNERLKAREDVAYTRRRFDIEEERRFNEQLRSKLAEEQFSNREREAAQTMALKKKYQPDELELERGAFEARKPLREAEANEKIEAEMKGVKAKAGDRDYMKGAQALHDITAPKADQAQAKLIKLKIEQDERVQRAQDDYVEAVRRGDPQQVKDAKLAMTAAMGQVLDQERATNTLVGTLAKEAGNEITRLSAELSKVLPGDEAYTSIKSQLEKAKANLETYQTYVRGYIGAQEEKKPAPGPIKDRFQSSLGGGASGSWGEPSASATPPVPTRPAGLITVPEPSQTEQTYLGKAFNEPGVPQAPPPQAAAPDSSAPLATMAGRAAQQVETGAGLVTQRAKEGIAQGMRPYAAPPPPSPVTIEPRASAAPSREQTSAIFQRLDPQDRRDITSIARRAKQASSPEQRRALEDELRNRILNAFQPIYRTTSSLSGRNLTQDVLDFMATLLRGR